MRNMVTLQTPMITIAAGQETSIIHYHGRPGTPQVVAAWPQDGNGYAHWCSFGLRGGFPGAHQWAVYNRASAAAMVAIRYMVYA